MRSARNGFSAIAFSIMAESPKKVSRKHYRTDEYGDREALAESCVECGSTEIYGRDMCHACYMRDYRRSKRMVIAQPSQPQSSESPSVRELMREPAKVQKSRKASTKAKPEQSRKARTKPVYGPEHFETESKARAVRMHLRAL